MRTSYVLALVCAAAISPSAATASTLTATQVRQHTTRRDTTAQGLERVVITGKASNSDRYSSPGTTTATKTETLLRDTPQSVSIVTRSLIADQSMRSMADVIRYVPGLTMGQGEGHRDAPTIRGNSSTADFFIDGVRDDAQYFRDLYNVERVEDL